MKNVMLAEPSTIALFGMGMFMLLILALLGATIFLIVHFSRKSRKPASPSASPVVPATQIVPRKCPKCGAELKPDVSEGLCPACLLQRGIATEGGAPPGTPPFIPPTIPDLARLFPQLEILELIGQGGMGAVYKARQPSLDRFVALKILAPRSPAGDLDFAGRFTREARALAKLSHPNIVGVYDFGRAELPLGQDAQQRVPTTPVHYFIMEYVDGPNLRQVEQAGKLSPREALEIIPQICAALQFAHDEGIVHRDIKPENVLLDKKGRVKIADFGLAKILGQEPKDFRLTGARDIMGTPHYMAPEQVEKPQTVDHRADIYSLGVVFYEMLTGELPLGKFQPPSSCARGVQIDVRLDEVVLRALAKEPELRYQQASQVKTAVETIAGTSAAQAAATTSNKAGLGTPLFPPSFGLTFTSRFALNVARTGWVLGCLAALGFIPGWKWMFGFSGFFGFIGFAVLIESIHRLRHHIPFGQPAGSKITLVIVVGVVLILAVVLVGFFSIRAYLEPGPGEQRLKALVEDFFHHNFRDVTSRETLEWGEVTTADDGSVSIRYQYRAKIWDKDTVTNNQVFTFAPDGKFVSVKGVYRDPKERIMALVEKFFGNNYRDITSRETLEWGDMVTAENGTISIRYKYRAKIWDKDTVTNNQVFVFDAQDKFVSVKDAKPGDLIPGNPAEDYGQTVAGLPPVVVETQPVSGARDVEPGVTEIRVRFSKEMADGSWSWSTAWENSAPEIIGQPHYESDGRTCVAKVKLEPGRTYAWWLNSNQFKNFTDLAGRPAVPYLLIFQTKPN
jgi:predicted Ser/Thr protein kinase